MQYSLQGATAAATGRGIPFNRGGKGIQYSVAGTGAVTATFAMDISQDGINWVERFPLLSLSGTNSASDAMQLPEDWDYVRFRLLTITGTSASAGAGVGA
jgi:hypothetical protein